jgi:hypothetical protein
MNPYDVLGVPSNATDAQIKAAYRKLVKQYHPDVSDHSTATATIAEINEAYDILGDPEKRHKYDHRFSYTEVVVEEDPREVYKREFIRRKKEEAMEKRASEERLFRKMYKLNIALALLAFLLTIDEFLPSLTYQEPAHSETVVTRRVRGTTYRNLYINSPNFRFAVPSDVHPYYDYGTRPLMEIEASPIFKIPTHVEIPSGNATLGFRPPRTFYSFVIPFHYLFLACCAFVLMKRKFNRSSFSLSFMPICLYALLWAFSYFALG